MKKPILILLALCFSMLLSAQRQKLKISFNATHEPNEYDQKVRRILTDLVKNIKQKHPDFPYEKIYLEGSLHTSEFFETAFESGSLITITAYDYLVLPETTQNKFIPLGLVKKNYKDEPYYSARFISNAKSKINSLHSTSIKRLLLAHPRSSSGYILPLWKLFDAGIIATPTIEGVQQKGWECILTGKHEETLPRVMKDTNALGATGQIPEDGMDSFRIILDYEKLPQNIVLISRDLEPYKQIIEDSLIKLFNTNNNVKYDSEKIIDIFGKSSFRITGFAPYKEEYTNAYQSLYEKIKKVEGNDTNKSYPKTSVSDSGFGPYLLLLSAIIVLGFILTIILRNKTRLKNPPKPISKISTSHRKRDFDIEAIRHKIQSGDIEEAIDLLRANLKGKSERRYREIIVQEARWSQLVQEARTGRIKREDETRERNNIINAIVDLLNEVENQGNGNL